METQEGNRSIGSRAFYIVDVGPIRTKKKNILLKFAFIDLSLQKANTNFYYEYH